jgi:ubiquitin-conjugating enzyme E2 G1
MSFASKKLQRELNELQQESDVPFTVGLVSESDLFKWNVAIMGQEDTIYEGSIIQATMDFPPDYPYNPPKFRFAQKMFHPNIYQDGHVCISILHRPVSDSTNEQELMEEKWKPVLGVKEIILSVLCVIYEPNLESPANVDASKMLRESPGQYKQCVRKLLS